MEFESRDDVERLVVSALPERAARLIVPHLQPAVRFNGLFGSGRRSAMRLGGGAALPSDVPWPEHDGRMMHLVAVVDLAQVAEVDPTRLLPTSGHLHFFYDAISFKWGYDPEHRNAWKVELIPDSPDGFQPELRHRVEYQGDDVYYSSPVLLEENFGAPFVQWTIPHEGEEELADIEWERNERGGIAHAHWEGLEELDQEVRFETAQMFGWPTLLQNPMRLQCQLVSNGIDLGDGSGYESARAAELHDGLYEWVLLLQVPSWGEYESGGRWGNGGMLYFWIHRDDLREAKFDRVWAIVQSG